MPRVDTVEEAPDRRHFGDVNNRDFDNRRPLCIEFARLKYGMSESDVVRMVGSRYTEVKSTASRFATDLVCVSVVDARRYTVTVDDPLQYTDGFR